MGISYNDISLEECFIDYHNNKTEYVCDADKKEIETIRRTECQNIQN